MQMPPTADVSRTRTSQHCSRASEGGCLHPSLVTSPLFFFKNPYSCALWDLDQGGRSPPLSSHLALSMTNSSLWKQFIRRPLQSSMGGFIARVFLSVLASSLFLLSDGSLVSSLLPHPPRRRISPRCSPRLHGVAVSLHVSLKARMTQPFTCSLFSLFPAAWLMPR